MAALAIRDEQPSFTPTDVLKSQAEDLATPQTGEQHRVDHRPIPILAQRRDQLDDVVVIEDLRQMPDRSNQRDHPPITRHRRPHRHAALDRVVVEFTERARDANRTPPRVDNRRRIVDNANPSGLVDRDHRRVGRTGPLDADELEHVTASDVERVDVDDGEEHLQVVDNRQRRVRSQPGVDRLQIVVDEWMAERRSDARARIRKRQLRERDGVHVILRSRPLHHRHRQRERAGGSPTYLPGCDATNRVTDPADWGHSLKPGGPGGAQL